MNDNKFLTIFGILIACLIIGGLIVYWFLFIKEKPAESLSERQIKELKILREQTGAFSEKELQVQKQELEILKNTYGEPGVEELARQREELEKLRQQNQ